MSSSFSPHNDLLNNPTKPSECSKRQGFYLTRADKIPIRSLDYLLERYLESDSLGLVFGEPGSGKSLFLLDLACAVATGSLFHGLSVKKGAVLYIAGEGHNGLKRRLRAWEIEHGLSLEGVPLFISSQSVSISDTQSVKMIIDNVLEEQRKKPFTNPALVIIDTLARNFGDGDENSARDMNKFIAGLDTIRCQYDCCVLCAHHTGTSDKRRGRGSSALKGAMDVEYGMEKKGEMYELYNTKSKDFIAPPPLVFTCKQQMVATEDGKLAPTPVFDRKESLEIRGGYLQTLSSSQKNALVSFCKAAKVNGKNDSNGRFTGLSLEEWKAFFYSDDNRKSEEAKRKAFERAKNVLIKRGILTFKDGIFQLTGQAASSYEKEISEAIRARDARKHNASDNGQSMDISSKACQQNEGRLLDGQDRGDISPLSVRTVPGGELSSNRNDADALEEKAS